MAFLPTRVRRLLRSRWTITLELTGIALTGVAATLFDQHPGPAEQARLVATRPVAAWVVEALRVDRIFTAEWFLALVVLTACSLAVVAWDQWRRVARDWRGPAEGAFRGAPFRRELSRPATAGERRVRIATRGRMGSLGSPLFHTGLLVATLAGIARMLWGADAAREAFEGEVLSAGAAAFETHDPGALASRAALPGALRFVELVPTYYGTGELLGLAARLEAPGASAPVALAVNAPLDLGSTRLYLTQRFGPAALLEVEWRGARSALAFALTAADGGDFAATAHVGRDLELHLRAPPARGRTRPPGQLDVRALSGGALLAAGRLERGSALSLPGGGRLVLHDVRWWARLVASRDPSTWAAYAGFALAVVGVALMFALVRVDTMVLVEPAGADERVVVALRAQRLAPLFAERFERLVEREARRGRMGP